MSPRFLHLCLLVLQIIRVLQFTPLTKISSSKFVSAIPKHYILSSLVEIVLKLKSYLSSWTVGCHFHLKSSLDPDGFLFELMFPLTFHLWNNTMFLKLGQSYLWYQKIDWTKNLISNKKVVNLSHDFYHAHISLALWDEVCRTVRRVFLVQDTWFEFHRSPELLTSFTRNMLINFILNIQFQISTYLLA